MSIGESLAEARRQAGLSIYQVSQQTRVREAIIRGIERDDFSACGGDFYARGHVRSIARAVGADPEPLVGEYDATVGSPRPVTVAELFEPVTPLRVREPRGRNWAAALGLVLLIVVGFGAYHFVSGTHTPAAPAAAIRSGLTPRHHGRPAAARKPPRSAPPAQPYASKVVIQLTAIEDCWVEFTTPAGGYVTQAYVAAGASQNWTFGHAVDMQLGNPGGVRLAVDGRNPLPPGTASPITLSLGLDARIGVAG